MTRSEKRVVGVLAALLAALGLWALFARSLWTPDEPRVAGIAREMLDHGDWASPTLNGVPFTEKPPLYFWCAALSIKAFGVRDWAPRLPAFAFGLGALAFTYLLGARLAGARAGAVSALVLATSARFFQTSQWVMVDSAVGCAGAAALYFLVLCREETEGGPELWHCFGLWVACTVAFMSKSLPALVAPGAAIFSLVLVKRRLWWVLGLRPWLGAIIFAVVAGPWLCVVASNGWLAEHIDAHILTRIGQGAAGHRQPFYFYLRAFPLNFLPWTVMLVPAAMHFWRERGSGTAESRGAVKILACWLVGGLIAYSIPSTKRAVYLMPVFPAAALLTGLFIDSLLEGRTPDRACRVFMWALLVVSAVVAMAWPLYALLGGELLVPAVVVLCAAVASVAASIDGFYSDNMRQYWAAIGATFAIGVLGTVIAAMTMLRPMKSTRPYSQVLSRAVCASGEEEVRIIGFSPDETLKGLVSFHTGRRMVSTKSPGLAARAMAGEGRVLVLTMAKTGDLFRARDVLSAEGIIWHEITMIGNRRVGVAAANFVPAGAAPD